MTDIDTDGGFDTDGGAADDLDGLLAEYGDAAVVDGLSSLLDALASLRSLRLGAGLTVSNVAERCACEPESIEWADDGDVAVPAEALVYYAAAVGARLRFVVEAG